ncbi:hypothetical protein BKA70DRAFT_1345460 [Coprinopsis sp. MPI-PUGE-AT-0042]|nr:hypothetical protein BKA70DRAFT_1345460 [Coprinopsis sp. MPI-PUGE-AT-0042]
MHRCFQIPEILLEICRNMRPQPLSEPLWFLEQAESANSRRALVNLSRTCSRFYQPATEELWSQIGASFGLNPLLDAIADDLWEFNVLHGGNLDISSRRMKREINYQDITSLKRYASRVRHLCVQVGKNSRASIQSLASVAVATTPNDGFLFPKLQELRLIGTRILEDVTPFSVALSPAITTLHVAPPLAGDSKNLSFLASVAHRCPNLVELIFSSSVVVLSRSAHVYFRGLQGLRTLKLMIDSGEAIATLSQLPLLESLTMTISSSAKIDDNTKTIARGGFPSLVTLICYSRLDLSPCLWVTKLLTPSAPLNSLIYSSNHISPLEAAAKIIKLLPRHVNLFSLARLFITECEGAQPGTVPVVDAATELMDDPLHLEYLAEFRSIKVLRIELITPISVGIQPLLSLAHLDLELLVVGFFVNPGYGQCTPKITLNQLAHILEIFPSLKFLGLPIDTRVAGPSSSKRPGGGFEHRQELSLLVGSSPIDTPLDVAEFLSDIIPRFEGISVPPTIVSGNGTEEVENPYSVKWEEVNEMVPFLARIREQGRNSA